MFSRKPFFLHFTLYMDLWLRIAVHDSLGLFVWNMWNQLSKMTIHFGTWSMEIGHTVKIAKLQQL